LRTDLPGVAYCLVADFCEYGNESCGFTTGLESVDYVSDH